MEGYACLVGKFDVDGWEGEGEERSWGFETDVKR